MDSLSAYEFHCIFNRTSDVVDLKGKLSVQAIDDALVRARESCKKNYNKADSSRQRRRLKTSAIKLGDLIEHGFANRAVHEAIYNPSGLVALTLKYGKIEAKRRILAQKRAQIRANRYHSMSRRYRR
jgi:hypothetical protein